MKARKILAGALILALIAASVIPVINSCNNGSNGNENGMKIPPPKSLGYAILNVYPHDTSFFTQGLAFYKGEFYEGTGDYGRSKLMKIDLKTGRPLKEIQLDKQYFGEGITIRNDTIYQLTWKEKVAFAYSLKDFRLLKQFPMDTEGWGLTHDGNHLIATDGGSNLYFYDPSTFQLLRTQPVSEAGSLAFNLNELEFINGYVYANQWNMPYILKINPQTGVVEGKADLTEVWNRIKARDRHADVPNGIAFDSTSNKLYVTGKRWPELYEIQFSN